jgi:hypothetical protein
VESLLDACLCEAQPACGEIRLWVQGKNKPVEVTGKVLLACLRVCPPEDHPTLPTACAEDLLCWKPWGPPGPSHLS